MKLHDLKAPEGSRRKPKRVGRGTGSGHGKTATRGTKGQNARGQGFRVGFEGGQMPLAQRLPKLGGFKNPFKIEYAVVNLSKLSRFKDGTSIDAQLLVEAGLVDAGQKVKVLGAGKLRRRLEVTVDAMSDSARTAIEARGGSVTVLNSPIKRADARRTRAAAKAAAAAAAAPATSRPAVGAAEDDRPATRAIAVDDDDQKDAEEATPTAE